MDAVLALERRYRPALRAADVPADAVTNSGSGVDPHVSRANAEMQSHRLARERGVPRSRILQLIDDNTDGRTLGVLGRPGVNVVELNLALDREAPTR
jgi:K+-transporting ATPase ATPase C chain